jgi:hypothetical protein
MLLPPPLAEEKDGAGAVQAAKKRIGANNFRYTDVRVGFRVTFRSSLDFFT